MLERFDRLLVVAIEHPYIGGAVSGASAALSAIVRTRVSLCDPLGIRIRSSRRERRAACSSANLLNTSQEGAVGDGGWATKKIARKIVLCATLAASLEKGKELCTQATTTRLAKLRYETLAVEEVRSRSRVYSIRWV